jgi:DNA-binding MarR family transcriptional regulator
MNGLELYLLGRKLMKLGEEALPPSGLDDMGASVRSVLTDVFSHPGSSVSEIKDRTGFPQSHVSSSVARLRDLGVLVTAPDPADRRRTLVRPAEGMVQKAVRRAATSVDSTLAGAMAPGAEDRLPEVLAALDLLGELIMPQVHEMTQPAPAPAGADTAN